MPQSVRHTRVGGTFKMKRRKSYQRADKTSEWQLKQEEAHRMEQEGKLYLEQKTELKIERIASCSLPPPIVITSSASASAVGIA